MLKSVILFSHPEILECSVPQVTVLRPILFTIFINSVLNCRSKGNVLCFTDDTGIQYSADSWEEVKSIAESDLKNINT